MCCVESYQLKIDSQKSKAKLDLPDAGGFSCHLSPNTYGLKLSPFDCRPLNFFNSRELLVGDASHLPRR
jgi:hypothetical protein